MASRGPTRTHFPRSGVAFTPESLLQSTDTVHTWVSCTSAHNSLALVVYVIRRYIEQRESLARTVRQQRDDLLKDVELAGQVQRLFLPPAKPATPGLEIAGMMHPARGVGGDYYDYFPIDAHTTQVVIADVAGKGVPAALLMSATAATMRLEANHDRNMLEQVERLNTGILSVSDSDRFVTLLVAEIDAQRRTLRYVNCGHNPALLFRAKTGALSLELLLFTDRIVCRRELRTGFRRPHGWRCSCSLYRWGH